MTRKNRVVIVGNGVAGNTALETIRQYSQETELVLISDEPVPFYSAVVLSDYVAGDIPRKKTFLKSLKDYPEVDLKLGTQISGIDLAARKVFLEKEALSYDRLILALGGDAVIPPIEGAQSKGVFVLKTLKDADRLRRFKATDAVVVGSGPTGVETAIALKRRGITVSLIEVFDSILPLIFDRDVGRRLEKVLIDHDIKVFVSDRVIAVIEQKGSVRAVRTEQREIPCQMVVFAVGVRPRTQLVRDAGITVGPFGGIAVDSTMATSSPFVYACGDCAEYRDPDCASLKLFWLNARQMGRVAGSRCVGREVSYVDVEPGAVVDIFGTVAGAIGKKSSEAYGSGTRIVEHEGRSSYRRIVMVEGKVVGAQFIGSVEQAGLIAAMIRSRYPAEQRTYGRAGFPAYQNLAQALGI